MENYLYALEDDFLDFYDAVDYSTSLDSPSSNDSDQENVFFNSLDSSSDEHKSFPPKRVHQRKAANMRERRRMKSINQAFECLRQSIPPTVTTERKLSKVDTLKLAIRYIGYLSGIVESCSDYSQDKNTDDKQEKVIVRCHFSDFTNRDNGEELLGHSLSWTDSRNTTKIGNNRHTAKLWIPESPTESDLINISSFATDFNNYR
ncbi:pancreas transcription factor 1 subunit alpha-like [Mytilus edulis]|uniref:Pancreas-specific transcription factor 1a n=2 Tax=Mytilus TaxID=6548 RepID=A0A8B6GCZ8_MYTGA|nr:PTF1A [Mytilus edulis]VDI62387.1 pancreas-specific transcription factor 1a [Mytilus galloprovincialis]